MRDLKLHLTGFNGKYSLNGENCTTIGVAGSNTIYVQPDWISVEDRLPTPYENVLVYAKNGVYGGNPIDIEFIFPEGNWNDQGIFCTITHWMPLPKPPEGQ